ncbi:MmyB family transcriptional regulator [Millisia brevis]
MRAAPSIVRGPRGVKDFRHQAVGDMTLDWQTLRCVDDPDQQLVF